MIPRSDLRAGHAGSHDREPSMTPRSVPNRIHDGADPRNWYCIPTIATDRPERRRSDAGKVLVTVLRGFRTRGTAIRHCPGRRSALVLLPREDASLDLERRKYRHSRVRTASCGTPVVGNLVKATRTERSYGGSLRSPESGRGRPVPRGRAPVAIERGLAREGSRGPASEGERSEARSLLITEATEVSKCDLSTIAGHGSLRGHAPGQWYQPWYQMPG